MEENEGGKTSLFKNYFLVTILILALASLVLFIYIHKDKTCGDGTLYDKCSSNKPYFCENGILVEKANLCSCPEDFKLDGDSCFSEYMTSTKIISLPYSVNSESGELTFPVYEGFYKYSREIPRFIDYRENKKPTKKDFKLKSINNSLQREFLIPLVARIQNLDSDSDMQAKIAISIVQNIPYNEVDNLTSVEGALSYKYPYEVLYDNIGICSEKSDLLILLLRELGYGVATFYFPLENHEGVGIKCPVRKSADKSGYCYIETTSTENVKPFSPPQIIEISDGRSIGFF